MKKLFTLLIVVCFLIAAVPAVSAVTNENWDVCYDEHSKIIESSVTGKIDLQFSINLNAKFRYNGEKAEVIDFEGYYKLFKDNINVHDWNVTSKTNEEGTCIIKCKGIFEWRDENPVFMITNSNEAALISIEMRCNKNGKIAKISAME